MGDILADTGNLPSTFTSPLLFRRDHEKRFDSSLVIGRKYRSGAIFLGSIKSNRRNGDGQFQWPCGALYEGTYAQDLRHGSGKQVWQDGSKYIGDYKLDSRDGHGNLQFANGDTFEGQFLQDKKHGKGKYIWSNGSYYEGFFRDDKKWGYGTFCNCDGTKFQGFYCDDVRQGPGVLSYADGRQDVGIWRDEHLISLCTVLANSLDSTSIAQYSINSGQKSDSPMKSKPDLDNIAYQSLCQSLGMTEDEFLAQIPEDFYLKDILSGIRSQFGQIGSLESLSIKLLEAASFGDAIVVKQILATGNICPDVSDYSGHCSLLSASVNCHVNVMNVLLDYGANINQLNLEGMSSLSACHLLLYTEDIYINNIGENMKSENLFNIIEWDKNRSCVTIRNERQLILEQYESGRSKSASTMSKRARKRIKTRIVDLSQLNKEQTLMNNLQAPPIKDELLSDDEEMNRRSEHVPHHYDWKINFYRRTIDRLGKLDSINSHFQMSPDTPPVSAKKTEATRRPQSKTGNQDCLTETLQRGSMTPISQPQTEDDTVSTSRQTLCEYPHFVYDKNTSLVRRLQATRRKLINVERKPHFECVIDLLTSRGADPNAAVVPLPVIFYAIKTGNVKSVSSLLQKGADPSIKLMHGIQIKCMTPLHIAVALPVHEAITITKLLLQAGADPNSRDMFFGENEPGRTPLHIACCREDNYHDARTIIELLLQYGADPNAICHGNSPLSLAISSGNDLAVDLLLKNHANPGVALPNGTGSPLCVAAAFTGERRRKNSDRLKLIDKLVRAGADPLQPVLFSERAGPGTVVDYAHFICSQDRRIAHSPYHALTIGERECHSGRKELLTHLSKLIRSAMSGREDDPMFAGHGLRADSISPGLSLDAPALKAAAVNRKFSLGRRKWEGRRKFRFCYECGRSVGLRLQACPRCKFVFFCSKTCKAKAWASGHKDECFKRNEPEAPQEESNQTVLPPIVKVKEFVRPRVNSYINTEQHCICELQRPSC